MVIPALQLILLSSAERLLGNGLHLDSSLEMGMPLWLPTMEFWVRIHASGEYRYSVFARLWHKTPAEGFVASAGYGLPEPLTML